MSKTRYTFSHRGGDRYYWYSGRISGDSRVEEVDCPVDWFWAKPEPEPYDYAGAWENQSSGQWRGGQS